MPSYPKTTLELLRRKLQEIDEELEQLAPAKVREKRAVEQIIKSLEADSNLPYASTPSPWEAISLALNVHGDWKLSKKDLLDEILKGGYLGTKPKAARGLLNDSVNHHLRKGILTLKGDLVGRPKRTNK